MKRGLLAAFAIVIMKAAAYAQMGGGQGGEMMDGHSGWGMGYYGWWSVIVIVLFVVLVVAYIMKRK